MKPKRLAFALCLLLLTISCLSACAASQSTAPTARQRLLDMLNQLDALAQKTAQATTDYTQVYRSILSRYLRLITDSLEPGEGETGVWEATSWLSKQEALSQVGYAIRDISGDGVPELLIGAITEQKNGVGYGSEIYAAYTCANGRPKLAFEGWARSRYHWMDEGMFYYSGSSGASSSAFGQYLIDFDGDELLCQDFYFTAENRAGSDVISFYHNTTGEWNSAVSSELTISENQFWQIDVRLESAVTQIPLTPFSFFQSSF